MMPRKDGSYHKGIAGFSVWADMLSDNKAFSADNDSLLFERMLCQDDATTCLIDGRGCAAEYFRKLSETPVENISAETIEKYETLSKQFTKVKALAKQTRSLLGSWDNMEQRPAKLAEKEVREKACGYIKQIEALEQQSLKVLREIV